MACHTTDKSFKLLFKVLNSLWLPKRGKGDRNFAAF